MGGLDDPIIDANGGRCTSRYDSVAGSCIMVYLTRIVISDARRRMAVMSIDEVTGFLPNICISVGTSVSKQKENIPVILLQLM